MSLRIAVLGGTGFVGRALAECWPEDAPQQPTFLVHRSRPAWLETADVEDGRISLDEPEDVRRALEGYDVLINLLRPDGSGWYPEMLRRLQPSLRKSGIRRCVHASSIDVYAGVEVGLVDEDTPPRPLAAYEMEHLAAEQTLVAAFPETVVLRLGAIFGAGGRNVVSLAEEIRSAPTWKLALRRALYGERRMHLVSVQAVRDALVRAALCGRPLGSRMFLVTDDAAPENNFAYVQDCLAEAFGRSVPRSTPVLPRFCLRLALKARGLPTGGIDRRFSSRHALSLGVTSKHFGERLQSYAHLLASGEGDMPRSAEHTGSP